MCPPDTPNMTITGVVDDSRRRREPPPEPDERCDRRDLEDHQRALDIAARANTQTIDQRQNAQSQDRDRSFGHRQRDEFKEVTGKGNRDRGHSARLDHEQQSPPVKERRHWAKGVPKIGILAANLGAADRQLGIDKGRGKRDHAAGDPYSDDQDRRVDVPRNLGRVDENSRSDDPAHDQHGRIKHPEAADEAVRSGAGTIVRAHPTLAPIALKLVSPHSRISQP